MSHPTFRSYDSCAEYLSWGNICIIEKPRSKTFLTQQVTKEKLGAVVRSNRDHALLLRPKNNIRLILSWC